MTEEQHIYYEERAKIIAAMAHPTRLFILDELLKGEQCVCQLAEMIGHDVSTVSKHLTIMKNVGLIKSHKQGTTVYHSVMIPCVKSFFSCVENVLQQSLSQKICAMQATGQSESGR
ncbi:MAG: winged helix-turn-helix transcriptional regulator [Candidatus Delongbacteria bacterium]|nr:winged helix-turn-helix transcriptional regulator [Candidatus Delongbacteria bacterium]